MTRAEYEKNVKERLYEASGESKADYEKANGNFENAVSLAVANFSLWV